MPSLIHILDDLTINQIAAGEVIEHATSVVKELVENALDAGASSLLIEIRGGGRQLIRITDNGCGMEPGDALACFKRHATSKLRTIEDFEQILSMGFRGEALAAIASVAKVKLVTRVQGRERGTLVQIEGGVVKNTASIPAEIGTIFEVGDLFFNVPARKKFLKSPSQDQMEIQKYVTHVAFANPSVHFRLVADNTAVMDVTAAANPFERASQLLSEEMFEDMIEVKYVEGEIAFEGVIGRPSLHRPNRTGQTLLINQRPVTAWTVSQAVLEGYGTSLPEKRYPVFILHVTLPAARVDVNVHPQKKEVRFRHERELKEIIKKGVMAHIAKPLFSPSRAIPFFVHPPSLELEKSSAVFYETPPSRPIFVKEEPPLTLMPLQRVCEFIPHAIGTIPRYILIDRSPLVNEQEEGICLVDVERARKRIAYEEALKGITTKNPTRQLMLIPLPLNLSGEEKFLLNENEELVKEFGFSWNFRTQEICLIEEIPSFLKEGEVDSVFKGLLGAFLDEGKKENLSHRIALAMVQRMRPSVKDLSMEEATLLIKTLFQCQQPYFSPSGQPLLAWISLHELARYFR